MIYFICFPVYVNVAHFGCVVIPYSLFAFFRRNVFTWVYSSLLLERYSLYVSRRLRDVSCLAGHNTTRGSALQCSQFSIVVT
jgi:hypothetical protein